MRHSCKRYRLNRNSAHRKAMMANMAVSLAKYEKIKTTITKAKALRPFFESLVTIAKKDDKLHAFRLLISRMKNESIAHKMLETIAPMYNKRNGGYLRIIRLGYRKGDNAEIALIEMVDSSN